ncbi:HRAS-like suppressor 3, partial [Elysia marginata]
MASSSTTERKLITHEEDFAKFGIEAGSRLKIKRPGYSHWAIYLGHGEVCHLTQDRSVKIPRLRAVSKASAGSLPVEVVIESFTEMTKGGKATVEVDNSADSKW